jgi:hypothetical protein
MKRDTLYAKFMAIFGHVSPPPLLLGVSAGNFQRALVGKSGMIRTQMGDAQKISNGRNAWDAVQ